MNNLEQEYTQVSSIGQFSRKYFSYLGKVLESIDENEINKMGQVFESARSSGSTIFVAGNGGSSTTASTMANDIGFDILKKTGIEKAFRVFSLVDNTSVITAIANDVGYENVFVNQLKIHYREGDCIIVISASGNSPNILKAVEYVKSKNGKTIGFLGFTGGKLMDMCDVKIHVQSQPGEYGPVEDAHLIMNHILAHWFQYKLK
jgi:D-sedoheptulose 7-phosphate isomerase